MRLHCLGTAGYHPNATRHTSCYFLPESGILLDAGTGVFRLPKLIETDTVDILLSHAHLDHVCGLTFLLDVFYQRPIKRLRIWGEQAKLDAIKTHLFSDLIFPVELDAEWLAIDDLNEFQIGQTRVAWRPQDHPGGSVAYRLDWPNRDKSLVYMTDTTGDVSDVGIAWCRGADLLMHECYFDDSLIDWAQKTGHSWTSRVAEITERSAPQKLLVTHVNPLIPCDRAHSLPDEPAVDKSGGTAAGTDRGKVLHGDVGEPSPGGFGDASSRGGFGEQCDLIRQKVAAEVILAEDQLEVEF